MQAQDQIASLPERKTTSSSLSSRASSPPVIEAGSGNVQVRELE